MNSSRQASTRISWFIIFGALVFSVFIYGVLGLMMDQDVKTRTAHPETVAQMRPFFAGIAIIMLITAVAVSRFRVDGKIGGDGRAVSLSPRQFQVDSIVALALSEVSVIMGLALFFVGASLKEFALFGAGTLFVDFAFILPRGLQFWSAYERRGHN